VSRRGTRDEHGRQCGHSLRRRTEKFCRNFDNNDLLSTSYLVFRFMRFKIWCTAALLESIAPPDHKLVGYTTAPAEAGLQPP